MVNYVSATDQGSINLMHTLTKACDCMAAALIFSELTKSASRDNLVTRWGKATRQSGSKIQIFFEEIEPVPLEIPEHLIPELERKAQDWGQLTSLDPRESVLEAWMEFIDVSTDVSKRLRLNIEIKKKIETTAK